MTLGKPLTAAQIARIREVHAKEPELSFEALGERFGITGRVVSQVLKGSPRGDRKLDRLSIGVSVRVKPRGKWKDRTGEVIELPGFPFRDRLYVKLDGGPSRVLIHAEDLRVISADERPGQIALLEVSP